MFSSHYCTKPTHRQFLALMHNVYKPSTSSTIGAYSVSDIMTSSHMLFTITTQAEIPDINAVIRNSWSGLLFGHLMPTTWRAIHDTLQIKVDMLSRADHVQNGTGMNSWTASNNHSAWTARQEDRQSSETQTGSHTWNHY